MTLAGRYGAGVAAVAFAGLLAATISPGESRPGIVWGLGLLVRFAVVGVAAFALMPISEDLAAPMLATMVGTLVALLLVEGVVAMREHSREDER